MHHKEQHNKILAVIMLFVFIIQTTFTGYAENLIIDEPVLSETTDDLSCQNLTENNELLEYTNPNSANNEILLNETSNTNDENNLIDFNEELNNDISFVDNSSTLSELQEKEHEDTQVQEENTQLENPSSSELIATNELQSNEDNTIPYIEAYFTPKEIEEMTDYYGFLEVIDSNEITPPDSQTIQTALSLGIKNSENEFIHIPSVVKVCLNFDFSGLIYGITDKNEFIPIKYKTEEKIIDEISSTTLVFEMEDIHTYILTNEIITELENQNSENIQTELNHEIQNLENETEEIGTNKSTQRGTSPSEIPSFQPRTLVRLSRNTTAQGCFWPCAVYPSKWSERTTWRNALDCVDVSRPLKGAQIETHSSTRDFDVKLDEPYKG